MLLIKEADKVPLVNPQPIFKNSIVPVELRFFTTKTHTPRLLSKTLQIVM